MSTISSIGFHPLVLIPGVFVQNLYQLYLNWNVMLECHYMMRREMYATHIRSYEKNDLNALKHGWNDFLLKRGLNVRLEKNYDLYG